MRTKSVSRESAFRTVNTGSYLPKNVSESHIIRENRIVCRLEEAVEKMWVFNRHFLGSRQKISPWGRLLLRR